MQRQWARLARDEASEAPRAGPGSASFPGLMYVAFGCFLLLPHQGAARVVVECVLLFCCDCALASRLLLAAMTAIRHSVYKCAPDNFVAPPGGALDFPSSSTRPAPQEGPFL